MTQAIDWSEIAKWPFESIRVMADDSEVNNPSVYRIYQTISTGALYCTLVAKGVDLAQFATDMFDFCQNKTKVDFDVKPYLMSNANTMECRQYFSKVLDALKDGLDPLYEGVGT